MGLDGAGWGWTRLDGSRVIETYSRFCRARDSAIIEDNVPSHLLNMHAQKHSSSPLHSDTLMPARLFVMSAQVAKTADVALDNSCNGFVCCGVCCLCLCQCVCVCVCVSHHSPDN